MLDVPAGTTIVQEYTSAERQDEDSARVMQNSSRDKESLLHLAI